MVGRQAGCWKVVGIFILNGIILVTNRKKETHFDYNVKNFVAAGPFNCTQNRCGPLRFVKVFLIILDLAFLGNEHLNRLGKKQISSFGLPPIDVIKIK